MYNVFKIEDRIYYDKQRETWFFLDEFTFAFGPYDSKLEAEEAARMYYDPFNKDKINKLKVRV